MEIVIEKEKSETIPEKPKDVEAAPGSAAHTNLAQEASPASSPAPGINEPPPKTAEQILNDFETSTVNPVIRKIGEQKDEKDKPLSSIHQSLLDSGILEGWIAKILCWGFKHVNVLAYNFYYRKNKKVIADEIEVDRQDVLSVEKIVSDYIHTPEFLEYFKKINGIFLTFIFMEGSMIANMNNNAHEIEPQKEQPKKEAA